MKRVIKFKLNGETVEEYVQDNITMVDFLRKQMHLTGTKRGCEAVSYTHLGGKHSCDWRIKYRKRTISGRFLIVWQYPVLPMPIEQVDPFRREVQDT